MSKLGIAVEMITGIFEKKAGFHQGDDSSGSVGTAVLLVLRGNKKIIPVLIFARDDKARVYVKEYTPGSDVNSGGWSCLGGDTSPRWWLVLDGFLSSKSPSIYFQAAPYGSLGLDYTLVDEVTQGLFIIRLKPFQIKELAELE